ncbi:MAG: A24 family peptidase [Chloroflexaceae bacterium]|jgi:leader peptidase (prepilin peptidase)/N-methyltransferase|nr:A24 family peptidase [Chloroflexaceae bacterium]
MEFYLSLTTFLAMAAVLVYVSITDLRERRIPNKVMFPALAVALAVALLRPERWSLLAGGLIAGFVLLLPILVYGLESAGGGDMKLALFIGLVVGWPHVSTALMLTFGSAAIFVLVGFLFKRMTRRSSIAFGPFLALGGLGAGALMLLGG